MVNEAREALRALVLNQRADIGPYEVLPETGALCAAIGARSGPLFIVIEQTQTIRLVDTSTGVPIAEDLVRELTDILGPGEDGMRPWGGTLTWLALKAALTTGVEP